VRRAGAKVAMAIWVLACLVTEAKAVFAGGPLTRARGEAVVLLVSAKALHQRIDALDPRTEAGWQAAHLYQHAMQVKEAVYCDAPVYEVLRLVECMEGTIHSLEDAIQASCHLRADRRVVAELHRLHDRCCALEREIRRCQPEPPRSIPPVGIRPPWPQTSLRPPVRFELQIGNLPHAFEPSPYWIQQRIEQRPF
jgi:hypothetical protein